MNYQEKLYCLGYTFKYLKRKINISNESTNLFADMNSMNKPLTYLEKISLPYYPKFKKLEFIKYINFNCLKFIKN